MSPSPTRRAGITRLAAVPRPTSGCGHGEHIPRQVSQPSSRDGGNRTAESTEQKVEKTKRDLAGLVEEAAAGMRQLTAAMPGLNPIEMVKSLGSEHMPPVVVMSAKPEYALTAAAKEIGAAAIVRKPFAIDDLLDCIEGARAKA